MGVVHGVAMDADTGAEQVEHRAGEFVVPHLLTLTRAAHVTEGVVREPCPGWLWPRDRPSLVTEVILADDHRFAVDVLECVVVGDDVNIADTPDSVVATYRADDVATEPDLRQFRVVRHDLDSRPVISPLHHVVLEGHQSAVVGRER